MMAGLLIAGGGCRVRHMAGGLGCGIGLGLCLDRLGIMHGLVPCNSCSSSKGSFLSCIHSNNYHSKDSSLGFYALYLFYLSYLPYLPYFS